MFSPAISEYQVTNPFQLSYTPIATIFPALYVSGNGGRAFQMIPTVRHPPALLVLNALKFNNRSFNQAHTTHCPRVLKARSISFIKRQQRLGSRGDLYLTSDMTRINSVRSSVNDVSGK